MENTLKLEAEIGDAETCEPFLRQEILDGKMSFYLRHSDEIDPPKYEICK